MEIISFELKITRKKNEGIQFVLNNKQTKKLRIYKFRL